MLQPTKQIVRLCGRVVSFTILLRLGLLKLFISLQFDSLLGLALKRWQAISSVSATLCFVKHNFRILTACRGSWISQARLTLNLQHKPLHREPVLPKLYWSYLVLLFQHSAHLSLRCLLLWHKRVWIGRVEFYGWPVRCHCGRRWSTGFAVRHIVRVHKAMLLYQNLKL